MKCNVCSHDILTKGAEIHGEYMRNGVIENKMTLCVFCWEELSNELFLKWVQNELKRLAESRKAKQRP